MMFVQIFPRLPAVRQAVCCVALAALALPAGAEIFKCVDNSGHVTYSNVSSRGCQRLNLGPDPVVSRPPRPAGSAGAAFTPSPAGTPGKASVSVASTTPGGFPNVAPSTQKSRDNDRRRILEQELAKEQQGLTQAKAELAQQESVRNGDERNYQRVLDRLQPFKDRIAQHERNIQAINRELANLR